MKYWAQQGKVEQYFFYWEGGTWGYPDKKKMEHGLLKVAHLCLICLSAGALPSAAAAPLPPPPCLVAGRATGTAASRARGTAASARAPN